jgi:pyruvate,water dikinase
MEGSPVHQTMVKAMALISPLTLINPDAPEFRATNCQTLHDITRFCHEKAVHEMFSFGQSYPFFEHSSKQLFYQVPLHWWVINLDDGFLQKEKDKYIYLENIVSIPMLALWEGIIAVPWAGPPPLDIKGFASVLFRATTDNSLLTSTRSSYSKRNYFMISRNFCSFYARFGVHFSTVESMVSDRTAENYISFSFKGGAADFQRRLTRVQMIATLLEEYGFRVQTKEDTAVARIEGFDQKTMEDRLKVLGYLTMHTRQLDMVMANPRSVAYFTTRLRQDLANICPLIPNATCSAPEKKTMNISRSY